MKKLFTLAVAVLASLAMSATTIFSYTLTAAGTDGTIYDAEGGTAKCVKAMASGNSNEITIGDQTFYKFNSSSAWEFTLADEGTFAEGDVISITAACGTSAKKGKGVTLNGIAVTGDFPASTANTLTYTVQAGDAIDGKTTIQVKRNDSDIKFGTIVVEREAASTDPVEAATISGENGCLVGNSIELTCTAAKATTYQWSMNGTEIEGANAKKYTFSPTAAGEYSFTCAASNEYTTTPVVAAAHVVTVMDPANAYGEIIKATLTSGTAATVTGVIGGTADVSLSSSKKMDKGKYFGITLAAGNFKEGDTVVITMTTAGSNYPCLFADKERTNCLFLATETSSDLVYRIVLPAAANSINTLYVSRGDESDGYKWNPVLSSMSVIRPMGAKSKVEELINVKVNGTAISATNLNELKNDHYVNLDGQYAKAPVVTYTKKVTTTYDDESVKIADVDVEVTAEFVEANNVWEAEAQINDINYRVIMQKAASHTVTYKDGETVLGTEIVAHGGHPEEYTQYQSMSLATFEGWYRESDLDEEVAYIEEENINEDVTFYAKFVKAYAQSINIEKAVMQNGKGYAIIPQLGTLKYASNITGSLDSLDNSKKDSLRNYAYLGLKVKQAGALLNFRLAKGSTVKVKFGNIAKTPLVSINGGEYAEMTITDKVYSYTAEEEAIVSIKTADGSAVVFQQIMINEDIQAPELFTITCAAAEHGTVSAAYKMGIPGEVIKLSFTMDEGYTVASCYANDVEVVGTAEGEFFTMPAANVTITATFGDETTAIDNTNAELKAVKVIENGQIFIIKNGVKYNAQGAVVR